MAKVSIGLRGWRFDEEDVFTEDGEMRNIEEMPPDIRQRIARLAVLVGSPCDACWLIHGDENIQEANVSRVVYGEPLGEVSVCAEHEPDFLYWFREEGGSEYAGSKDMQDAFFEWFDAGNRAPEDYEGMEHVETDPDDLPEPTTEVPEIEDQVAELDEEEREALDIDLSDLDID